MLSLLKLLMLSWIIYFLSKLALEMETHCSLQYSTLYTMFYQYPVIFNKICNIVKVMVMVVVLWHQLSILISIETVPNQLK